MRRKRWRTRRNNKRRRGSSGFAEVLGSLQLLHHYAHQELGHFGVLGFAFGDASGFEKLHPVGRQVAQLELSSV
jgi:hypothetical protein